MLSGYKCLHKLRQIVSVKKHFSFFLMGVDGTGFTSHGNHIDQEEQEFEVYIIIHH
jgi:hypothetical protein